MANALPTISASGNGLQRYMDEIRKFPMLEPQEEYMLEAFANLIRNGDVEHPWLPLSHRTQLVCDSLAKSAREKCPVEVVRL